MYEDLELPSEFLVDSRRSLKSRSDFEDLCDSLDDLQQDAMKLAFREGFKQGVLTVLHELVEGDLDRESILEMFEDQLGLGDID